MASWRTAYRRLAVGRMLSAFDEPDRSALRTAIAEVGLAKAATLVPAIERTGTWPIWVDLARQLSAPVLQERVSAALQAAPRGREVSPPGERFRRAVLSAMPGDPPSRGDLSGRVPGVLGRVGAPGGPQTESAWPAGRYR